MHQKRRRPKVDKDRKEPVFFTPVHKREKTAKGGQQKLHKGEVDILAQLQATRAQLLANDHHGENCRSKCRELGRRTLSSGFKDASVAVAVIDQLIAHFATLLTKTKVTPEDDFCLESGLKYMLLPEFKGEPTTFRGGLNKMQRWQEFLELLPHYLPEKPSLITGSPIHRTYRREEEEEPEIPRDNFLRRISRNFRFLRN